MGKGLKEALKGFVVVAGSSITTTMAGIPILTLAMRFSELLTENGLLGVLCSSRLCKLPGRRRLFRSFMLEEPACPLCSRSWGDCIDYYVVGLKFQDWFLTNNQCEALLGHWEDRDTWLDVPPDFDCPEKSELWHG